jgi:hypothetical protein
MLRIAGSYAAILGRPRSSEAPQRPESIRSAEILAFKAARLRGFDSLPNDLSLVAQDYGGVKNNVLVVERPNATELGKLGVGYSREKNAKDGCLRLYSSAKPPMRASPVLCLDKAGRWWSKDGDEDTAVRLKLSERD